VVTKADCGSKRVADRNTNYCTTLISGQYLPFWAPFIAGFDTSPTWAFSKQSKVTNAIRVSHQGLEKNMKRDMIQKKLQITQCTKWTI
jgi:hypothetical protein